MRIAFGDFRIGELARARIERSLARHWVSEGPNVEEFERGFGALFGYPHCVATSSGTDADIVACAVAYELGARRGDEIVVPASAFVAVGNAVLAAGFTPVFVDIERSTLNIDPARIEDAIGPRTRAILAVHNMGKPCAMDAIREIARRHDLLVIEDACEAHGARYHDRPVGTLGDLGTFSFYAAHLICTGEGGMAVTEDAACADALRSIRSHGRPPGSSHFDFQRFGLNAKMNDLEAALGIEGVARFADVFETRKRNLRTLLAMVRELEPYATFLDEAPWEVVAPHAFPLVLRDPALDARRLAAYLEDHSIQTKTLFGSLPTQHGAFAFLGYEPGSFPVAEYVGENGLHFGCHQHLTPEDLAYVAEVLRDYFKQV